MATVSDALVVQLTADIKGLQASLSEAQNSVRRFKTDAEEQVTSLTRVMEPLRAAFIGFVTVYGAFKVGQEIANAGIQWQGLQYRMKAATGDAGVAAEAMAFVRSESNRLGLDLLSSANSFASFSASALRSGMTLGQTKEVFTGIAEAVTAMHLPADRAASAFLAIEQMASKTTVQMQELKLQLAQAIPGAFEIMAKATGHSVGEFNKLMEQGRVATNDALPKLAAAFREQFGGAATEAAKGAQAAFNLLGNALLDLKVQFANSGFLDALADGAKKLTETLNDPATKEGLSGFASLLGDIARAAVWAASEIGGLSSKVEQMGDDLFQKAFGDKGKEALQLARRAKSNGFTPEQERVVEGFKLDANALYGVSGNGETQSGGSNNNYTLGKTEPFNPNADKEAHSRKSALGRVETVEKSIAGDYDPDRLKTQLDESQRILEDALKKQAITKQRFDDDMLELQEGYAKRMQKYITKEYGDEVEKENLDYKFRRKNLDKLLEDKLISVKQYYKMAEKLEKEHQNRLVDAENAANKARRTNWEEALDGFLGIQTQYQQKTLEQQGASFMESLQQGAQHNRTLFELAKVAAIAKALLSARQSVVDAYAWGMELGGPPLAAAFAGIAAAAQAANIAAIASTSFGGGGSVSSQGGGGSGSSGMSSGSSAVTTTTPAKPTVVNLNLNGRLMFSARELRDLIDGLNEQQKDGYTLNIA